MKEFIDSNLARRVVELRLPRYGELPTLELYMDQVICVVNGALRPLFSREDEAVLTPTMVGNYVKQKVVSPPVKKRYTRNHVAYFIAVALLKQVFSIAEVGELINRQIQTYTVETAYDYFCDQLEQAVQAAFGSRQLAQESAGAESAEAELVRSAVLSLANKIYVQKYLEFTKVRHVPDKPVRPDVQKQQKTAPHPPATGKA